MALAKTNQVRASFAPKLNKLAHFGFIHLNAEESKRLLEDIKNPPEPTPAYLRAKTQYNQIIKKAC